MDDFLINDHIETIRKQKGWTQYRLAKEAGIPHSSLSTMINQQHVPSMANLIKICKAFGMSLAQFFDEIENIYNNKYAVKEFEILRLWNLLDDTQQRTILFYILGLTNQELPPIFKEEETETEEVEN